VGFELSGLWAFKAGALSLEPHLQSILALVILEIGSPELFSGAVLEPQSS
jgi:hypothetical protein